jgi:hypothetical protein
MGRSNYIFFKSLLFAAITAALSISVGGCNNMPNNGVPIYVHIDSPTVTYLAPFGSTSNSISGVWASAGSHNLGAYEMPVDIPILAQGSVTVAISAGIYDNGIVNAPVQYPFYKPDIFTIANAIPGHIYHHKPVYTYIQGTQVAVVETFDADNQFTNVTPIINSSSSDSNVYEGFRSGGIILPSTTDSVTAYLTHPVQINTNGRQAYVELNYKMNNPNVFCEVGIMATAYSSGSITDQQYFPKVELTPSKPYWNKIYLDFNTEIGSNHNYYFQIFFIANHPINTQQDTMFIDNVKLLYFN